MVKKGQRKDYEQMTKLLKHNVDFGKIYRYHKGYTTPVHKFVVSSREEHYNVIQGLLPYAPLLTSRLLDFSAWVHMVLLQRHWPTYDIQGLVVAY